MSGRESKIMNIEQKEQLESIMVWSKSATGLLKWRTFGQPKLAQLEKLL